MNWKLIYCGLFGHQFNERTERKEQYNGRWYVIETQHKCEICKLSDVDISGGLGLANLKYGINCTDVDISGSLGLANLKYGINSKLELEPSNPKISK